MAQFSAQGFLPELKVWQRAKPKSHAQTRPVDLSLLDQLFGDTDDLTDLSVLNLPQKS